MPKDVRDDVFKLYSFVRVVDDYVDRPQPDKTAIKRIEKRWNSIKKDLASARRLDDSVDERVLGNIAYVVHRYNCKPEWVDSFLKSMRMDLDARVYETIDDTLEYVYGSAEVIGLFMAAILGLPVAAQETARLQGRAMQFINFIRDIAEDNELGRCYFPREDLITFGLKDLSEHEVARKPAEFREFVEFQVERYTQWQREAAKGFRYIPKRSRIAIRTAVDMYNWTAQNLAENPSLIFEKKLKPSRGRVLRSGVKRVLYG